LLDDGFDIRYEKIDNRSSNPSKIQYRHPGLERLFGSIVDMPNDTLNPIYFVHPCFQDEAKWKSEASNYSFTFKEILKLYAIDFKKNAKELSRKTGIPYMSIVRTLHKTKKELKQNLKK
jgi:hypothetical protein